MNAALHILSAVVLVAAGVIAGRAMPSSAGGRTSDTASMVDRRAGGSGIVESVHLDRLRAAFDRRTPRNILRPGMERLDLAELEGLAKERPQQDLKLVYSSDHWLVTRAALEELYRREGAAALERVSAWPDPSGREAAFSVVMSLHISEDWEAAMTHIEASPEPFNAAWLSDALDEAAGRNADDFMRVSTLIPEADWEDRDLFSEQGPLAFAANFDFAKVHAAAQGGAGVAYFREWAHRQPESAWEAVADIFSAPAAAASSTSRQMLSKVADGVMRRKGKLEGMDWLGGKVAGLPPEARAGVLGAGMFRDLFSGEEYARFFARLEPADILTYLDSQVSANTEVIYPTLDLLPREDLILCLSRGSWGALTEQNADDGVVSGVSTRLQQRFSLTPEEVQRINSAPRK